MKSARNAASTAALVLFLFQLVFADSPPDLYPKESEEYEVQNNKIYFRKGNEGLILEQATEEAISKYYSDRGANIGNPFLSLKEISKDHTIFLLTLINRGRSSVTFTPRYVTLQIKHDNFYPMDFAILLEALEGLDRTKASILQKSIFHSSEALHPNEVITKFLVFPSLPKKFDELMLEFDYLFFGDREIRARFYFLRKKPVQN
ncbi:MAG TPA: hypothetical protein VJ044_06835 [Candidatus Hodarchaeales archaeon]|nr:hypothetical protein [Candidatus Hodarchaeales archaeon]